MSQLLKASSQVSARAPVATPRPAFLKPLHHAQPIKSRRQLIARSSDPKTEADQEFMTEAERKKAAADRLRAAEKFMVIGQGSATCKGCGFEYTPDKGDPEFPVAKGINFQDVPEDYTCPICGSPKTNFESKLKVVAGFAENQKYGLGTNSMTGDQKTLLIYGSLAIFFLLFIAGYALD